MADLQPTERTRLTRIPERAVYDREAVYRILDEALVAHVGFEAGGVPAVVPMAHWRNGDNRIAILVPCHRIVGSDGRLTGYGGGLWRERPLLDHEQGRGSAKDTDQRTDAALIA